MISLVLKVCALPCPLKKSLKKVIDWLNPCLFLSPILGRLINLILPHQAQQQLRRPILILILSLILILQVPLTKSREKDNEVFSSTAFFFLGSNPVFCNQ
jgi:hypothetical protein